MPTFGEQIHAKTQERDAMFGRMAAMAQPNVLTGYLADGEVPLTAFDPAEAYATGRRALNGVILPGPGAVLEAVGGGETRRVIEDVLRTYSDVGVADATPGHRWRAAEHFRPYWAIEALTQAVERLIDERVRMSRRADTRSEG